MLLSALLIAFTALLSLEAVEVRRLSAAEATKGVKVTVS